MYFGPLVTLLPFCFCTVDRSYQFIYPTFLLPSETDAGLSTDAAIPPSPPPDAAVPFPSSTPMDGSPPKDDDGRPIAMEGQAAAALAASGLAARAEGLAAPSVGADGGVSPAVEASPDAMSSALALARMFLPTVPLPTVEYNLPILEVQRYWPFMLSVFLLR